VKQKPQPHGGPLACSFVTDLRLHLRCPKALINEFLQRNPKFQADSQLDCVAVAEK
jgi:hypothetical protein